MISLQFSNYLPPSPFNPWYTYNHLKSSFLGSLIPPPFKIEVIYGSPPNVLLFIGDLLGYKIFYYSVPVNSRNAEEIEVVSASHTTHSLIFLEMYTNYSISILAFNPAGEGPRSDPISVKTLQVSLKINSFKRYGT